MRRVVPFSGVLRFPSRIRGGILLGRTVVNGRAGSWRLLCYGLRSGGLVIDGRDVMIGIGVLVLVVITIDRGRSRR